MVVAGCGSDSEENQPPNSPPAGPSLAVSLASINYGESTELTAIFPSGEGSIDNGIGVVTSNTPVSVHPTETTLYTLTVIDGNNSYTKSVTVTVLPGVAKSLADTVKILDSVLANVNPSVLNGYDLGVNPCLNGAYLDCLPQQIKFANPINKEALGKMSIALTELSNFFIGKKISAGIVESLTIDNGGDTVNIDYQVKDFTHFQVRAVYAASPEYPAYVALDGTNISFSSIVLNYGLPVTTTMSLNYREPTDFDYELAIDNGCDTTDPRKGEKIVGRMEKRAAVINAKLMIYHPRFFADNGVFLTCNDTPTDATAMMLYYAYAAEDTLATSSVYMMPRTLTTIKEISSYPLWVFCQVNGYYSNYCTGDIGPWSLTQPMSELKNPYCISDSGVVWGSACASTEAAVASPDFSTPVWTIPSEFANLVVSVPSTLN